jgi:hypothetical protein
MRASYLGGVDPGLLPPSPLVTGAMNLAVVDPAERDEFVPHFPSQRTRLHEAQVVGIGMLSPTHATRLLCNEPQMYLIAMGRRINLRLNRRM